MVVSDLFLFHPENWGNDPIFDDHIFSDGLKPPTSNVFPKMVLPTNCI